MCYRKEKGCYIAEVETADAYLPFTDVIGHLKKTHDESLWQLIIQDSIKDCLAMVILGNFYDTADLDRSNKKLYEMLSVFPHHPISHALLHHIDATHSSLLTKSAEIVATWHQINDDIDIPKSRMKVTTLDSIDTCLKHYPPFIRSALKKLHSILHSCASFLSGVYLHGSMATLDYVPGFSDLDLVYILNLHTAQSPDALLKLRQGLIKTNEYFYKIDRFQHHGPYTLTPTILNNYIESYLPLAVWRTARPMLGSQVIYFNICKSPYHQEMWFRRSAQYYRRHFFENGKFANLYDAKLFVSMATLLPAVAHAYANGTFTSKAHALEWVQRTYSDPQIADWIERLTRIREENPYQEIPSAKPFSEPPDRTAPMNSRIGEMLSEDPYLRVMEICDQILGIEIRPKRARWCKEYFNFPKPLHPDLYIRLAEKVKNRVAQITGVTRMFISGTFGAPGISDLDLLIVTQDRLSGQSSNRLNALFDSLSMEEKAIIMHPPMAIVPESLVDDLEWLFPLTVTVASHGKRPQFGSITPEEQEILSLVQITDFSVAMNGRLFQEMKRRRKIDVRLLLNVLGGLKYTVELLRKAGGEVTSAYQFLYDIQALRTNWIKAPCIDNLPGFLSRGVKFVKEVNQKIHALWQEQPVHKISSFAFRTPSTGVDFKDGDEIDICHLEKGEIVLHLPSTFSVPLRNYAMRTGPLSNHLNRNLPVPGCLQSALLGQVLSRRADLLNNHFRYLIENGLHCGFFAPFHFGWQLWKVNIKGGNLE